MEITIRRLFNLGWSMYNSVEEALAHPEMLENIKKQYAAFHGLSNSQDVEEHLVQPRMCALPDTMPISNQVCKWPDNHVTWDIVADIRGLSRQQVQDGITEALNRWVKVCGIRPEFTPGNPQARILVGSRGIDGAFGVLAESELPCGASQCHQWYDNGENWALFDGPGKGIDFVRVACHELGHALGMNHIGSGNLLAPVYSLNIWTPQAGDIADMQARYGPPLPTEDDFVIRVKGQMTVDGYRLTKMIQG